MKVYKIYQLLDPNTREIRYIGVTCQSLTARLTAHITRAHKERKTHNHCWIISLGESKPIIEELKRANTQEEASQMEIDTIKEYFDNGYRLTNHLAGGYVCPTGPREQITLRMKVDMYSREGVLLNTFDSMVDAERQTGVPNGKISGCCKGKKGRQIAGGYVWRYKGESFDKYPTTPQWFTKKIKQYSLDGELLKIWDTFTDIITHYNWSLGGSISVCCKKKHRTYKGYKWRYENDEF